MAFLNPAYAMIEEKNFNVFHVNELSLEISGIDGQKNAQTINLKKIQPFLSYATQGLRFDIKTKEIGMDGGINLYLESKNSQPINLKQIDLNIALADKYFDSYYRMVAGKWQKFDLENNFFFNQELILFNAKTSEGIMLLFDDSYGRLFLKDNLLKINFLDGRDTSIKNFSSNIYIFPVSKIETYENVIYKSKFPDGKDNVLIYSADDIHAVFGPDFIDRLSFFKKLKEKDAGFKTTFLVVADVYKRRNKPIDIDLLNSIKELGFIKFGFHGTYHSYPVDSPTDPKTFDLHFVDFNGDHSNETEWLQQIISKGINILKEQNIDYSVFRAPEYQYTPNSIKVLSENGIRLIHLCQNDVYNPIRMDTSNGWLYKIYDSPCDRGFLSIENGKETYDSVSFKKELLLNGKETSFLVHIWELWYGENPYDGNANYYTFNKLIEYLQFLESNNIDYNWQYAEDYYKYLNSLSLFSLNNLELSNNIISANITIENPLEENIYLKLPLKDNQFIKSAYADNYLINYSQNKKNLAILEIPKDINSNSEIKIELTDNSALLEPVYTPPYRKLYVNSEERHVLKNNTNSDTTTIYKNENRDYFKLNFNTIILVGLFLIYSSLFIIGLLRHFKNKQ